MIPFQGRLHRSSYVHAGGSSVIIGGVVRELVLQVSVLTDAVRVVATSGWHSPEQWASKATTSKQSQRLRAPLRAETTWQ